MSPPRGVLSRRQESPLSTETHTIGLGSLFRRQNLRKADSAEMAETNAAAAVAKFLVQGGGANVAENPRLQESTRSKTLGSKENSYTNQQSNEIDVKLRPRKIKSSKKPKMTVDLPLDSAVVPLASLPLDNTMTGQRKTARIEQWFELKQSHAADDTLSSTSLFRASSSLATGKNPSVLLEITFTFSEWLSDSEDEMDDGENTNTT
jgi:hypothetical protein